MSKPREGVSLDAQRSRIRAYCEAKDLELVDMRGHLQE